MHLFLWAFPKATAIGADAAQVATSRWQAFAAGHVRCSGGATRAHQPTWIEDHGASFAPLNMARPMRASPYINKLRLSSPTVLQVSSGNRSASTRKSPKSSVHGVRLRQRNSTSTGRPLWRSIGVPLPQYGKKCLHQDLYVEPQTPVVDVPQIKFDALCDVLN